MLCRLPGSKASQVPWKAGEEKENAGLSTPPPSSFLAPDPNAASERMRLGVPLSEPAEAPRATACEGLPAKVGQGQPGAPGGAQGGRGCPAGGPGRLLRRLVGLPVLTRCDRTQQGAAAAPPHRRRRRLSSASFVAGDVGRRATEPQYGVLYSTPYSLRVQRKELHQEPHEGCKPGRAGPLEFPGTPAFRFLPLSASRGQWERRTALEPMRMKGPRRRDVVGSLFMLDVASPPLVPEPVWRRFMTAGANLARGDP